MLLVFTTMRPLPAKRRFISHRKPPRNSTAAGRPPARLIIWYICSSVPAASVTNFGTRMPTQWPPKAIKRPMWKIGPAHLRSCLDKNSLDLVVQLRSNTV